MVAYARKHRRFAIFEWQAKEKGWYLYAGEYPTGWEKKVKVVNLPTPVKKGSVSWSTKLKSTKRGDDSFETCPDIVPYKGGFPPIGNIVLEGSPPPLARPTVARERHLHRQEIMLSLNFAFSLFYLFMGLSHG